MPLVVECSKGHPSLFFPMERWEFPRTTAQFCQSLPFQFHVGTAIAFLLSAKLMNCPETLLVESHSTVTGPVSFGVTYPYLPMH